MGGVVIPQRDLTCASEGGLREGQVDADRVQKEGDRWDGTIAANIFCGDAGLYPSDPSYNRTQATSQTHSEFIDKK